MEVQFEPDLQDKIERIARESGRAPADLIHDAVAGYMDDLAQAREMIDSRYEDVRSGKVKLIPGEEAFARLHARIDERRDS